MTNERTPLARLGRAALGLFACTVAGVVVGAMLGSWVGGLLGHPEGEGFIGFLLGWRIGGALGVVAWGVLCWRARGRRTAGST